MYDNYDNIDIEHVGIILKEEFMEPLGLSMNALAKAIGMPANCIHGIVHGTRGITGNTDLRLTRYFGLSQGYFLRLQNHYEMITASRAIPAADLEKIIPIKTPELSCVASPKKVIYHP
ncbi:MAG: HigA family addiction module antidote protein [Chitinispirillales bacterium]|jgi:addiction module HigA family antidote|nr:HigA family addiction module antidote protein [Chitinispirillales bacterium]